MGLMASTIQELSDLLPCPLKHRLASSRWKSRVGGFSAISNLRLGVEVKIHCHALTLKQMARCVDMVTWTHTLTPDWASTQMEGITRTDVQQWWHTHNWRALGHCAFVALYAPASESRTRLRAHLQYVNPKWKWVIKARK